MSKADELFVASVKDILQNGTTTEGEKVRPHWEDGTTAYAIKKFGMVNRYDLREEFPAMTLRRTALKSAMDEILWIYQKKSNRVSDLSSHIWDAWTDENGTIGKAYGYQIGQKSSYPEGEMDQMDRVLYDLKHTPFSRRIITSTYTFSDLHEMELYPCAYSTTWNVTQDNARENPRPSLHDAEKPSGLPLHAAEKDAKGAAEAGTMSSPDANKKLTLNLLLNQRSQDMLTANNWNVAQYAILLMMVAQVNDMVPGELVHVVADAHIYDRHVPLVKELIGRKQYPAPVVRLNPEVKDFYAFTTDDLIVENYQHGEQIKNIPVAI